MTLDRIRGAFVWTKIAADAGQSLDLIRKRKDLEQQSGGTFWWGIGESKSKKIGLLLAIDPCPVVFFSKMRSHAHPRDSRPSTVALWETYEAAGGQAPLPPHVIVTSRGHDRKGNRKSRHYALVCKNPAGLLHGGGGDLDAATLCNFGHDGKPVGSSQITAVVDQVVNRRPMPSLPYPITASATLVAPYAVRLGAPRTLSPAELKLLDEVSAEGKSSNDWMAVVKHLRRSTQSQTVAVSTAGAQASSGYHSATAKQ
jgi:hypothetical protein